MKNSGPTRVIRNLPALLEVLMIAIMATCSLWLWRAYGVSFAVSLAPSSPLLVDIIGQLTVLSVVVVFISKGKRCAVGIIESRRKFSLDDGQNIQLFANAIRATPDGMALTRKDGTFIWANDGLSKLTGYPLNEIIGSKPSLFKSGKQSDQFYKRLWTTVLAGLIFRGVVVNKRKDGTFYTGEVTITPITDIAGKVTHFSVLERDITKRVEVEESLRQGQDRFRLLVESMNECLIMLDEHERIQYANPMLMSKLGFTASELINHDFLQLLDEENQKIVLNKQAERRAGSCVSYELIISNRKGVKKIFKISPRGIFDSEGKMMGSIAVLTDLSAEQETEKQLVLAQRLADSMNKFQTSMLDNISHEFRTPLAGIMGFAEILAETATDEQVEMVDLIQGASQRLMRTLNSLISMSTLLSDEVDSEIQSCDVDREVEDLVSPWIAEAAKKNVLMTTRLSVGNRVAEVNREQFHQVIESLVENAIKFTDEGEIRVTARVKDEESFEVLVQDTGIGIDEAAQEAIFEPFRQASSGMTRSHSGIGISLSVVRLLVVKMGGEISLTSLKNVGTEFVITLPLAESASGDAQPIETDVKCAPDTEDASGDAQPVETDVISAPDTEDALGTPSAEPDSDTLETEPSVMAEELAEELAEALAEAEEFAVVESHPAAASGPHTLTQNPRPSLRRSESNSAERKGFGVNQ